MDSAIILRKRRRLVIDFAVLGLVIAAVFFAYFEADPRLADPTAFWTAGIALVLCPGSLLFVTALDIEPGTVSFALMWLVIGVINSALYAGIGTVVGRSCWKANREPPGGSQDPGRSS